MKIRQLCVASAILAVFAAVSCSNSSGGGAAGGAGGGVGSKCSANSECTGYSNPVCMTELKPLSGLIAPDSGTAGQTFGSLSLPFPGGYCSNPIDSACQTDADCGKGGGCYRPLTGVKPDVLASLDNLVKVFSVSAFAKKGLCLSPCTADTDCRVDEGYKCGIPLDAFIKVVNPDYKNTYCVVPKDVSYLLVGGGGDAGGG